MCHPIQLITFTNRKCIVPPKIDLIKVKGPWPFKWVQLYTHSWCRVSASPRSCRWRCWPRTWRWRRSGSGRGRRCAAGSRGSQARWRPTGTTSRERFLITFPGLQGDPAWWSGQVSCWSFHCQYGSAWADRNLAESAERMGVWNQSQLNPGTQPVTKVTMYWEIRIWIYQPTWRTSAWGSHEPRSWIWRPPLRQAARGRPKTRNVARIVGHLILRSIR